jgi:rhodanese-related sulfurtransferase
MTMVPWLALMVAALALWLALRAGSRARAAAEQGRDTRLLSDSARDRLGELERQVEALARAAGVPPPGQAYLDLPAQEAQAWMEAHPHRSVLIDVRTPLEYEGGHVPGATLIPVDQVEARHAEVPKDRERVFVVCLGGTRSAAACEMLADKGYRNLVNIADGMSAWRGPIVRGPEPGVAPF